MKILHIVTQERPVCLSYGSMSNCLKLSLNAFLEMLEKTFCYYDFKNY